MQYVVLDMFKFERQAEQHCYLFFFTENINLYIRGPCYYFLLLHILHSPWIVAKNNLKHKYDNEESTFKISLEEGKYEQ